MTGKKSHPLEIFRSSGTFQRPDPLRKEPGMAGMNKSEMPVRPAAPPPQEFELKLSLMAAVVLLFTWIVVIAAAYLFGYRKGESSVQEAAERAAISKGDELDRGDPAARPSPANQPSAIPFGVSLAAYDMTQEKLSSEMTDILQSTYGIEHGAITVWQDPKKAQLLVFVGAFADENDPALLQLLNKLRMIDDYPKGRDKSPFRNAKIARHPNDPNDPRDG